MRQVPPLANLYWSQCGLYPGEGEISPFDFETRVKSAAKAGFAGIGIWATDLEHTLIGRSLKEMRAILDDNGVEMFEVEFLTDWFVDGARRNESNNRKGRLLEASAALGAHHVKVGDFYNTPAPMSRLVDEFGALCREAERFGATIGFEFMASAMIHTLEGSLTMTAGLKNGGVVVDIVHVMMLGITYEAIAKIPRAQLISVELNDGVGRSSPKFDNGATRFYCGEGEFDIAGFIAAVEATGYAEPWAVEVFGRQLNGMSLAALNARAFETTAAMFREVSAER